MTDPNGAAKLMVTWIPSTKTPVMLALIYQHHGSVMGYVPISPWFSPCFPLEKPSATAKCTGGTPQEESDLHGRSPAVATMGQTRRLLVNRSMDGSFL